MGYSFFVAGVPITKGSKTLVPTKSGRFYMIEARANRLKSWMRAVSRGAQYVFAEPLEGAIRVRYSFFLERPKTVKRELPCVKPDLDKLERAINDALQGIAFKDDGQVTTSVNSKCYADGDKQPGVLIEVFKDEKKK